VKKNVLGLNEEDSSDSFDESMEVVKTFFGRIGNELEVKSPAEAEQITTTRPKRGYKRRT
jgi:hypothetical protein